MCPHFLFITDALPEGIEIMRKKVDRVSYGHGVCRLRRIELYDLQCPESALPHVLADFYSPAEEHRFTDSEAYKFKYKISPFRHGRFKFLINMFILCFGWIIGLRPINWDKKVDGVKTEKPLMNIFPIAIINDNKIVNDVYGREEEWL